ncbi:MAG: outer membrane beta-barrel protein [Paludibacteraceae bacterium]
MKKTILFLALCACTVSAAAQYTVSGKVVSATDGSQLEMTTVRLFQYHGTDSTLVQGAQTDFDGEYYLTNIRNGEYKLFVSNIGYKEQVVAISVEGKDLSVKTIRLREDVQHLAEVQVQGHAAEMTVKGDTIEYNTAAYKVADNAMVEDLLKKMNGVQVDQQGNVTVNGETITAVRIDGKKFFGNDVQSATKNIPAEMIEKIQVIDEKSETAKLTGFEDDETEHIINLTLKQDRKKGVFGKYTGSLGADMVTENDGWFNYGDPAYGSTSAEQAKHFFEDDFRYNANIFTNLLLGESQTTIIGSANNTNEVRSARGRGNFGQDANAGITRSENIGANTNIDFNNRITKIDNQTSLLMGGDLAFNHAYNDTRSQTNKEQYAGEVTYLNNDSTNKFAQTWDMNLRLEFQYQIDSINKLILQPTLSYTGTSSVSSDEYTYYRSDSLVNDGAQNQQDTSRTISAGLRLTYNHKFQRPGRSLTLTGRINYSNTDGYSETYAFDRLLNASTVDQHTFNRSNDLQYNIRLSYVEPIYKTNHLLEIAPAFSSTIRHSTKDQYSKTLPNPPYEGRELLGSAGSSEYAYDSTYSNALSNLFYNEQLEVNYRWLTEKSDLTVGVRGILTQTHSTTYYGSMLNRDTVVCSWNVAPSINFRYKFGKKEFARVRYRGRVSQPTVTQMIPVRNNSDAMNETIGNLSLKPAFQHNFFSMYSRFNETRFSSIMTGIRGSFTQNALVSNTLYDGTGKRYSQTVNANALPWNISADLMYNTPFCNKMFQFNTRTMVGYNQRVAYTSTIEGTLSDNGDISYIPLGTQSLTGNFQASEDLTLRFTHDIVDIGVRGNATYSYTHNNITAASTSNVFNWTVTGDLEFHLPKSWNISAECSYTDRYGYDLSGKVNEVILNAEIEKSWGNATLALQAYDILHQKKNIVQVVSDNMVSYAKYNTLPTYFLLTFTYKLNRMGNLKATGMGGHMQEMIENGGKPGTPPMGPPPHMM